MAATIPDTESTPPCYYLLAWIWSRAFGTDEVGLRSLSALAGTALVPIAYAAARELSSTRGALITPSLVAVSPWLVLYSQDARSYALLSLLGGLSFLFFVRCLKAPSNRVKPRGRDPLLRRFSSERAPRIGAAGAAALGAIFAAIVVAVALESRYQRCRLARSGAEPRSPEPRSSDRPQPVHPHAPLQRLSAESSPASAPRRARVGDKPGGGGECRPCPRDRAYRPSSRFRHPARGGLSGSRAEPRRDVQVIRFRSPRPVFVTPQRLADSGLAGAPWAVLFQSAR
jgi:hypothetical protein